VDARWCAQPESFDPTEPFIGEPESASVDQPTRRRAKAKRVKTARPAKAAPRRARRK